MKVAFFPGCMVDMLYPEVGIAAVNVLEKLGCEVELPDDQVCCGQPFSNSGYIEEAKPMMKKGYRCLQRLRHYCFAHWLLRLGNQGRVSSFFRRRCRIQQ